MSSELKMRATTENAAGTLVTANPTAGTAEIFVEPAPSASDALGGLSGRKMPAGTPFDFAQDSPAVFDAANSAARESQLPANSIAVAMSGGVDSSTAAAILHGRGHAIVGLTMQLWNHRRLPELQGEGPAGASLLLAR